VGEHPAEEAISPQRVRGASSRHFIGAERFKDIGTMYLVFALAAGLIGGALSVGMRMELQQPGLQVFLNSHEYDVFTTAHGLIMIFFMVMPALISVMNVRRLIRSPRRRGR
jgi:heme/copper-type cytochrome/quinol oxidase subunit 1